MQDIFIARSDSEKMYEAAWLYWVGYKEDAMHILHELARGVDKPKKKVEYDGIKIKEPEETAAKGYDGYEHWWERANDWR